MGPGARRSTKASEPGAETKTYGTRAEVQALHGSDSPKSRPPLRRLARPWLLLTGVVMAAVVAAIAGASAPRPALPTGTNPPSGYYPATAFGGYSWPGDVTKIAAEWRVPSVRNTSNTIPQHRQ
jgi:hypothetical protein